MQRHGNKDSGVEMSESTTSNHAQWYSAMEGSQLTALLLSYGQDTPRDQLERSDS